MNPWTLTFAASNEHARDLRRTACEQSLGSRARRERAALQQRAAARTTPSTPACATC